jgi:phospho-N-acetylmuramoyl-pentapeptide-transferase
VIAIFTSGGVALLVSGFGTPILMRWLTRRRIGQQIREDGPALHLVKAGTPTMGGIAMLAAIVAGYGLGHLGSKNAVDFSRPGILVISATVLAGLIGLADDWLKVRHRRSLGLHKRGKFTLQVAVATAFALGSHYWAHEGTALSFTRYDVPGIQMGTALWVIWAVLIIVAASNAVNLTDGLDGLAAGSSAFCATVMALIGYWEFRNFNIYELPKPYALDLAVAALAIAGSCIGFLWWNAAPARIFMGDTGSLAIGTGLACLSIELNLQLLLPIIGGLFVIETLSVVAQVVSFRVFHTRIFRMAPLHHHFELLGWPETTVIVRFWIFSALCSALGLAIFYADFLSVGTVK